jgi:hypothetical protein
VKLFFIFFSLLSGLNVYAFDFNIQNHSMDAMELVLVATSDNCGDNCLYHYITPNHVIMNQIGYSATQLDNTKMESLLFKTTKVVTKEEGGILNYIMYVEVRLDTTDLISTPNKQFATGTLTIWYQYSNKDQHPIIATTRGSCYVMVDKIECSGSAPGNDSAVHFILH